MTIYGFEALGIKGKDKTEEFIRKEIFYVERSSEQAPATYNMLGKMEIGDLLYLKTYNEQKSLLRLLAIGIVNTNEVKHFQYGNGKNVKWVWQGDESIQLSYPINKYGLISNSNPLKYDVYSNTLYVEFDPDIQKKIVKLIYENKMVEQGIKA